MSNIEFTVHPALDPLPREPEKWHNRFVRYALMDPEKRSLLALYNEDRLAEGKPKGTRAPHGWSEAAEKWEWRRRAREYDEYNRRVRIQMEEAERTKMIQRHMQIAQAAQAKVLQWLKDPGRNLDAPQDVIRWMEVAIKLERQARGLPAELLDLQHMTDEQLVARYSGLLSRLGGAELLELEAEAREARAAAQERIR